MACDIELIEHICRVVEPLGLVHYKKMFGEYMVYIDEKPAILVCDNIPYIKMLPEIEAMMKDAEIGYPYEGAKQHYILDIDHSDEALAVLRILLPLIPYPKKRSALDIIRINSSRSIPVRALASAIIMTYLDQNEEKLSEL